MGFSQNSSYVEILQNRKKFQIAIMPCSRFTWIINSTMATGRFHHIWLPSGLGNYFLCKRTAVQTLSRSPEFVIQINPRLRHHRNSGFTLFNFFKTWCHIKEVVFPLSSKLQKLFIVYSIRNVTFRKWHISTYFCGKF